MTRLAVLMVGLGLPSLAHAEYKLAAGDTIEFNIAGAPDMHQKSEIGLDGSLSLPLIGEIPAAGMTMTDLRSQVRAMMSQKEYRQHTPGSVQGQTDVIWPDQVSLSVAEYRPVYLNGDVAKPGQQAFRPGMTVRQALSLAGGYDILRFRMDNPFLESADLRGAYESAWIDYAKEHAKLDRIRTELGHPPDHVEPAGDPPVPSELLSRIKAVEADYLKTRDTDLDDQRKHLDALLAQEDSDIASLAKQHDTESSGMQYDEDEFNRIQGLYKVGTLPLIRVVEARRVMLLSATQALQSEVEMQRAKTDREITRRKRQSLDQDRRLDLLKSEQDSQTKLGDIRARIQSLQEKLLYAGALKTQLARGTGGQPDLMLFRGTQAGRPVSEGTELQPGDVVEVALKVEGAGSSSPAMR